MTSNNPNNMGLFIPTANHKYHAYPSLPYPTNKPTLMTYTNKTLHLTTFIYYTFASKLFCHIKSSTTQTVKVAGGGYLDTPAYINSTPYQIQHERFSNDFKLLQLKGHAIIFGCDWIKQHNPIGLDLRDNFRNLTI
jgi:hypothetical protein